MYQRSLSALVVVLTVSSLGLAGEKKSSHAMTSRLQVLYSFAGGKDGRTPQAALLADAAGNLYGTTAFGNGSQKCKDGCGTVFELSPPSGGGSVWIESVLHRFSGGSDGATPEGKLISDEAGNLYGTTNAGGNLSENSCSAAGVNIGCGVVFELSPPLAKGGTWRETVLHAFSYSDGAYPAAGLTFDQTGNLYGTTQEGGGADYGVVFELSPPQSQGDAWTLTDIYSFTGLADGGDSLSDLTFDPLGNLYGTTTGNGSGGTVFELMPPSQQGGVWTETTIQSFSGEFPLAGVVFDPAGNLYGTTTGSLCCGSVFELSPSSQGEWTENVLYNFENSGTQRPYAGLLLDQSGDLYGTDVGKFCGSLYRLTNQGGDWGEAEYDFFNNGVQPCRPEGALIFGSNNLAYGTSSAGGAFKLGTVFAIRP